MMQRRHVLDKACRRGTKHLSMLRYLKPLETCPLFLLKLHCVSMIKLFGHRREFNPKPLGPSQKLKGMTDDQTLESCLGLSWVFNPAKCIN